MKRKTTKDILAESFLELINDKRISKITINDITNNCGMTPPTFYNYFKDKYDLVVWIYVRGVEPVISKIGDDEYKWRDILHRVASYYVREGDTLYIESISRLGRSAKDLLNIIEKGDTLISHKENIDTDTPSEKFMLTVFATLSQLEREQLKQRQR